MAPEPVKLDLFLFQPALEEVPARARQADEDGFDGLFIAETLSDPFISLSIAGAETSRVALGTSIALAFPRSPMIMAVASRDMQVLTGGRFVLGLGAQVKKHIERRFSMPYDRPAARMREYVTALREIWAAFDGERELRFSGEFYTLDFLPPAVNPGPMPSIPPIYLAAVGPLMFRNAAEVADGAVVHPLHTVPYLKEVAEPAIVEGLSLAGRHRDAFTLSVSVLAAVGTGTAGERERDTVRRQLAFYASTPAYRRVLELHGFEAIGERLSQLVRDREFDAMSEVVTDDMLGTFAIIADTWTDAVAELRKRYTGVVERVSFYYPPPAGAVAA